MQKGNRGAVFALSLAMVGWCCAARADTLSIYQIQSSTSDGDASSYDGGLHNVLGGIVTHKWAGWQDRVYLRDPAHPTWGAIVVKDWAGDVISGVQIGDWVSFTNVRIEEYRGTTFVQYDPSDLENDGFNVESTGNPVPAPTVLTTADLILPVDHVASEPYESMVVTLQNVDVGSNGLGKAEDNYELLQGTDIAWGADYMNVDKVGDYHPWIYPGAELDSITGLVEQYTKESAGWDYYQLLTRSTADIVPRLHLWLDIKPGSCPNSFNRSSHGILPVALMGTDEVDVSQVEVSTVRLSRADGVGGEVAPNEGPPGPHSVFADVATPFDGEPCDCHELEGDGIDDLSMKFKTRQVVAALLLHELPPGATVELVVMGNLLDGTAFEARDCVTIVPRRAKARRNVRR